MTVTRFDGTSLPSGWSAIEPSGGHVDVGDGYLALSSDPGADFDSLSGSVDVPEGPRAVLSVSGAFDYAAGLASNVNAAVGMGIDLLALDEPSLEGIRFAQYVSNISSRDTSWFGYRRDSADAGNLTLASPSSNLWGPRSWMRLTFDGVDQWTFRSSHTGKPGTWHTHITFTSVLDPQTFELALTAFQPDTNGREVRAAVVVDMDGRADDATTPPDEVTRTTLLDADLSGSSLPAELTGETNAGGTITVADGQARLGTDTNTLDSYAWLAGPTDLPDNHGLLIRYRVVQPTVHNSFAALVIRGDSTTGLPGAQVLQGKYRPGIGLLSEVNGSSTTGEAVRFLTAHPIAVDQDYDTIEFYGFAMLINDTLAAVDGNTGDWIWLRLEAFAGYLRARLWYDVDPEPAGWQYEGEDWTQRGTSAFVAWSHNDSTTGDGGGVAEFDVGSYQLYELTVDNEPEPEQPDARTLSVAVEDRTLRVLTDNRSLAVEPETRFLEVR